MSGESPRVAVTRDEAEDGPLSSALRACGMQPMPCPVLRHAPAADPSPLRLAARGLESFDWLVVASARAVSMLVSARGGAAWPGSLRTAAVGAATAAALVAAGARDPSVAPEAGAERLAEWLAAADDWPGRRVLLPRAAEGGTRLAAALRACGADVVEVVAYRTLARPASEIASRWRTAAPEAVVLASPSAVRALAAGIGVPALGAVRVRVALGPTTAAALASLGIAAVIPEHTDFACAAALVRDRLRPDCPHPPARPAPRERSTSS